MPQRRTFPVVICPGCDLPMQPDVTEAGPKGLHKTTFRCAKCSTETERLYKGDDTPSCVDCRNELLCALPEHELQALTRALKRTELPAGTVLQHAGRPVDRVYFPESGLASLVLDMSTGERLEAAAIGCDGVVGGRVLLPNCAALTTAVMTIAGSGYAVEAGLLRRFCTGHGTLATLISTYDEFVYAQAQQLVACNAIHSLEARLSRWLLRAHDLCGPHLTVTQEQIARLLGVGRTSVSLTAHEMQLNGTIRVRRGTIDILDAERLGSSACECHDALRDQRRLLLRVPPPRSNAVATSAPV